MSARDPDAPQLEPELERLARVLDAAGREEERDLAAAAALPEPRDRAALEARMDELWRGLDRRKKRRRIVAGIAILLPAAAILLVLLRPQEKDKGPGDVLLGNGEVEILAPPDDGSWDLIEWRGPQRAYVLRVSDPQDGRILLGPVRVVGDRYPLESQVSAEWPDAVVIELEWRLPDGTQEHEAREVTLPR